MVMIHAQLHTMAGPVIEDGYIRVEDGIFTDVGEMPCEPMIGEEVIDVDGAGLYPGFVDAHTHLGMWEDSLTFEGDDGNEDTDPITPQLRAVDALNPMDRCFSEACAAGVTTVITGPGSANPIGGQLAAIKTYGRRIDNMLVKAPVAIKMALGENPKSVYHGKNQAPTTRMATAALIREQLFKTRRYAEELERAETDEDFDEPEYDMKCEALLPVLRREVQVHFHAHRADDIFTAIRIGKEFDLDFVIVHGTDGHLIAEELKAENVPVLAGPFLADRCKPELKNQTPENPGILSKTGVCTAIITDHPVIPLQYLPTCAALAIREGMDREEALKAVTVYPAQICHIDDRVGTVEPGKDADFTIFTCDPLQMESKPDMVYVSGKRIL